MTLREKLEAAVGERAPHAVLKDYPLAVFRAVNSFPANSYLIPEFSLGGKFHADFVALSGASGLFDVEFLELEPIDMPMFKKNGDPTPRLSHALRQVSDWSAFIKRHESFVRESLLEESKRKDLLNIQDRETGPI
jgi:hypothetical protein